MSNLTLNTFPGGRVEALTILYMQNQELRGKTPSELADLYTKVYQEIRERFRDQRLSYGSVNAD